MSFCDKCGAYIPIGDTVCPACGYDPEAEAKKAREEAERAAAEERLRAEKAAAEAAEKARLEAEQRQREEQERQRTQQQQRWQQDPRQYTHSGGPAQGQYASQRTGTSQAHYASQRTGYSTQSQSSYYDETMRSRAGESVSNQKLSVLSYLGLFWLIPFITRKNDAFARYHSNQGLVLLVAAALLNALGNVFSIFSVVGTLGYIAGAVFGITNVLRGKREPLPLIGNFNLLK